MCPWIFFFWGTLDNVEPNNNNNKIQNTNYYYPLLPEYEIPIVNNIIINNIISKYNWGCCSLLLKSKNSNRKESKYEGYTLEFPVTKKVMVATNGDQRIIKRFVNIYYVYGVVWCTDWWVSNSQFINYHTCFQLRKHFFNEQIN